MSIISDYKEIYDLLKSLGNFEAQQRIMELREQHMIAREEVLTLKSENQALRERLAIATSVVFEPPYYWQQQEGQNEKHGPFCQVCYDGNKKLVRLQSSDERGWWQCYICNRSFTDKNYSSSAGRILDMY